MNFKELIKDSLTYPFTNKDNILILFVLTLGQVLIIPAIISSGYLIRIIESTLEGHDELPEFNNFKKLFIDGLKFAIVTIVYGIPAGIVSIIAYSFLPLNTFIIQWIPFIISIIVTFFVNIIFLMALTNMVYEKSIKGAFQFKRILSLIKEVGWKKYLIYLGFYTLIVEGLTLIWMVLTPDYLFDYFSTVVMGYNGSILAIVYLLLLAMMNTYSAAFESRFRGLIYPNKSLKTKNETKNGIIGHEIEA